MSHQVLSNNFQAADTPPGKENLATAREIKIVKNRVRVIRCPSMRKTRFWHRKGPPNPKPNQNSAAGDMRTRVRQVMGITLNAERLNHVHRGLPPVSTLPYNCKPAPKATLPPCRSTVEHNHSCHVVATANPQSYQGLSQN